MNRSITYKREAGSGSLDVTRKATKEVDDSITRLVSTERLVLAGRREAVCLHAAHLSQPASSRKSIGRNHELGTTNTCPYRLDPGAMYNIYSSI